MTKKLWYVISVLFTISILAACSEDQTKMSPADATTDSTDDPAASGSDNPFLAESTLFLGYPPFAQIEDSHFLPGFEAGMKEQLAEIDAIVNQEAAPTVENTLVPMELSGEILTRISSVFYAMVAAHTNDTINEIQVEIAPQLSAHTDEILLNGALFERVKALYDGRESLDLDPETLRLVEETHRDFVRAGAELSEAEQETLRAINTELAELQTRFSQNVLNEVNEMFTVVDTREELAGLTDAQIEGAADAADERDLAGK